MSDSSPVKANAFGSSLETKETLLHFSKPPDGDLEEYSQAYQGFIKALYCQANYSLSNALESSPFASHQEVNKTIRNLRFCTNTSLVEISNNHAEIKGSLKCRNKFCHICNRARSMKYASRLTKLLETTYRATDYKFYFITITMNSKSRKGDYLQELKDCQAKLLRSKVWSKIFGDDIGMICSYENVMKKDRYHIHSHNLVMCKGLNMGAKKAHKMIRDKWLKLTGDSYIVHLKLPKDYEGRGYESVVKELFKYSTKMGDLNKITKQQVRMLSKWVISSKGKNFSNARGLLRGHQVTSYKSKLDDIVESEYDLRNDFLLAATRSLKYNFSTTRSYHVDDRKKIRKDVRLKDIRNYVLLDTIYDQDDLNYLLRIGSKEGLKEVKKIMDERILTEEKIRTKKSIGEDYLDRNLADIVIDEGLIRETMIQARKNVTDKIDFS